MKSPSPQDRLIVALDTSEVKVARQWIQSLAPVVRYFKVGSELFTAAGPDILCEIKKQKAKIFLDLKFHDIPQTAAQAARVACQLGVDMFNVHASGGLDMMKTVRSAVDEICGQSKKRPLVIAVTVLTSFKEESLSDQLGVQRKILDQVLMLARLAKQAGMDGVVASAQEVKTLKSDFGQSFVVVTPGIRPAWAASNDQVRIVTPRDAVQFGSDYLVVGRPITGQDDPQKAAERILQELG